MGISYADIQTAGWKFELQRWDNIESCHSCVWVWLAFSWGTTFRNVPKRLELAGTAKYCPIYGGKSKGSAEGVCAVVRGV